MTMSTAAASPGLLLRYGYGVAAAAPRGVDAVDDAAAAHAAEVAAGASAKRASIAVLPSGSAAGTVQLPSTVAPPAPPVAYFDADISGIVPAGGPDDAATVGAPGRSRTFTMESIASPEPPLVGTDDDDGRGDAGADGGIYDEFAEGSPPPPPARVNDENANAGGRGGGVAAPPATVRRALAPASAPPPSALDRSMRAGAGGQGHGQRTVFRSVAREGRASIDGQSPEARVSADALASADAEDMTINTRIALGDVSDLFASPTAAFPAPVAAHREPVARDGRPPRIVATQHVAAPAAVAPPPRPVLASRPAVPVVAAPVAPAAIDMSRIPPDARRLSRGIANVRRMSGFGAHGAAIAAASTGARPGFVGPRVAMVQPTVAAAPSTMLALRSPPKSPIRSPSLAHRASLAVDDDRTARLSSIQALFGHSGVAPNDADTSGGDALVDENEGVIMKEARPYAEPLGELPAPAAQYVEIEGELIGAGVQLGSQYLNRPRDADGDYRDFVIHVDAAFDGNGAVRETAYARADW